MRRLINLVIKEVVPNEFSLTSIPYQSGNFEYVVKLKTKDSNLKFQFDFWSESSGVLKVFSNIIVKTYEFNVTKSEDVHLVLISIATLEKEFEDYMVKLTKRRGD